MVLVHAAEEDDQYLLVLKSDNVRTMYNVLRAIQFRERAIVCATDKGLKVTVEDNRCVQASAFLQCELFSQYQMKEANVNFCINLALLCECLNLYGTHSSVSTVTSLKMYYSCHGSPLKLLLEESGIVTDCTIKTLEPGDMTSFEFSLTHVMTKIIMKPATLRETFNDLDTTSEFVEISVHPDKGIKFAASGVNCTSETTLLKDSDFIEYFNCTERQRNQYRASLLKFGGRALNLAAKISLRIDKRGFFSVQYMIEQEGLIIFVEFFCSPEEDYSQANQTNVSF